MSVKALSAVFEESHADGSAFTVLLAMADWADHNGRCFPSLSQIALKARVSRSTAALCIVKLVELGELERVTHGHGPDRQDDEAPTSVRQQRRNAYRITLVNGKAEVVRTSDYLTDQVVRTPDGGSPDTGLSGGPKRRSAYKEEPSDQTVNKPSATTGGAAAVVGGYEFNPGDKCDAFALLWNRLIEGSPLKPVQSLTPKRRQWIRARLVDRPIVDHEQAIGRIAASSFCGGDGSRGFVATFDWYIGSPDAATKALEGQYDDRLSAADVQAAQGFRFRMGWGNYCKHDTACDSLESCDRKIALRLRAQKRSA